MTGAKVPRRLLAVALTVAALAPFLQGTPATMPASEYLATANSAYAPPSPYRPSLSSSMAFAAPVPTDSSNRVYFKETGHFVRDAFLNYWLMNGSAALYGYPISEEMVYGGKTVQYFERARFEYNPASARPWNVDLTPVGTLLTEGRNFAPAQAVGDATFYSETGHNLGGAFRQFWNAGGGEDKFGLPISEEMSENGIAVQYFQRTRLELTQQGKVQPGRVGVELLAKDKAAGLDARGTVPLARPGFNMSFRGNATWFRANWDRVISLNKGWGNLPESYVGRGLYAAAPADLNLYGRWARVTRGNRSIFVQFVDVIDWKDIQYVRDRGIVIDLGEEAFRALGGADGPRYQVSFDVLWPDQEP